MITLNLIPRSRILSRRLLAVSALAALLSPFLAAHAQARAPPTTVSRLIALQLQALWKQPVVVDYRPGGGTTLGMAISALTINPSLLSNMPYGTLKDLVGVSQVAQAHFAACSRIRRCPSARCPN